MQQVIQVTSLCKQFGNIRAVDDLSFAVQQGDVYGFLGQNGAGKSTTIRMLLSLIMPTAGDIKIFGLGLRSHRLQILRRTGAIIEKPDLYQYLSAFENLRLFAALSGLKHDPKKRMGQLEMVGLAARAHDKVKTYSQGMKQRLGIAVSLVHDPELVILDEPTNGLDPQGIADIRNLILHLSRELKKTIFVSSHLLSEIEQVATRVLIIDRGKKIVEGAASELFDPSRTVVEIDTLDNDRCLTLLQESQWQPYLMSKRGNGLHLKLHKDLVPQLHRWLVENNIRVISLQPRHTLEDFFLQVTSAKQHVDAFTDRTI